MNKMVYSDGASTNLTPPPVGSERLDNSASMWLTNELTRMPNSSYTFYDVSDPIPIEPISPETKTFDDEFGALNCSLMTHFSKLTQSTASRRCQQIEGFHESWLSSLKMSLANFYRSSCLYIDADASNRDQITPVDNFFIGLGRYECSNVLQTYGHSKWPMTNINYLMIIPFDSAPSCWQQRKERLAIMILAYSNPAYHSDIHQTRPAGRQVIGEALAALNTLDEEWSLPALRLFDDGSIMFRWKGRQMNAGVRFTGDRLADVYFVDHDGHEILESIKIDNRESLKRMFKRIVNDYLHDS